MNESQFVALLILLSISLLVCIAFMAIIMWLYLRIEKDYSTAIPEAKAIYQKAQEVLDLANEKAVHARETVQEARRISRRIQLEEASQNVAPAEVAPVEEAEAPEEE